MPQCKLCCWSSGLAGRTENSNRPEIDRRLAAGEPVAQPARDYELSSSSLQRHRKNCLKLASSSAIKKDAARGSAAVALLPSKEDLGSGYKALQARIAGAIEIGVHATV